jgi:hypothetical protein
MFCDFSELQMSVAGNFLLAAFFLWPGLQMALFQRLKKFHPIEYQNLGAPGMFIAMTPRTNWLLFRFLFRRQYKSTGDSFLIALGTAMLWFGAAYIVAFALVVALSVI